MNDNTTTIKYLKQKLSKFVKDRDWEQYHSPKNLSMSLAIEAAELMEHFQWSSLEEARQSIMKKKNKNEIAKELADIAIYVLEFAQLYDIDLSKAVDRKLNINARKYPSKKVRGKAYKYNYYRKL